MDVTFRNEGKGMAVSHARILVLEDSEASRFVIREVLERAGYTCITAGAADEALSAVRQENVDLLISDTILRGETGARVVREMRLAVPSLPVLYISGFPLEYLIAHGLINSAEVTSATGAFLHKPFHSEALIEAVQRLLAAGMEGRSAGGGRT